MHPWKQGLKREDRIVSLGSVNLSNHEELQGVAQLVGKSEGVSSTVMWRRSATDSLDGDRSRSQWSFFVRRLLRDPSQSVLSTLSMTCTHFLLQTLNRLHLRLTPGAWKGRGLLGCHIVPL